MSFDSLAIVASRKFAAKTAAHGNSLAQILRLGAIIMIAALSIAAAAALKEAPNRAGPAWLGAAPAAAR